MKRGEEPNKNMGGLTVTQCTLSLGMFHLYRSTLRTYRYENRRSATAADVFKYRPKGEGMLQRAQPEQ